jgi:hypothetical protein
MFISYDLQYEPGSHPTDFHDLDGVPCRERTKGRKEGHALRPVKTQRTLRKMKGRHHGRWMMILGP